MQAKPRSRRPVQPAPQKTFALRKSAGKASRAHKQAPGTRRDKANKTISKILSVLQKEYAEAHCELNFSNPLELLAAVCLSAQCTDKRVNQVTKKLFRKYKTAADYAKAPLKELEKDVKSTGFFRNKARNLKTAFSQIEKEHGGKIPSDFESLTKLAGVGRKTAHAVLGAGFNIPSGIVVDTHVRRLAYRTGLTKTKNVFQIERELAALVPKNQWIAFSHRLIAHGRKICAARKPLCHLCSLSSFCPRNAVPPLTVKQKRGSEIRP